jgi:hypothetical protein
MPKMDQRSSSISVSSFVARLLALNEKYMLDECMPRDIKKWILDECELRSINRDLALQEIDKQMNNVD